MNTSDGRTVGQLERRRAAALAALVMALVSVCPTVRLSAQLSARDSAFHALNRLAYGPRPGEVDRVAADGVMRWIDRQLDPERIPDERLAEREHRFDILGDDRGDLAGIYFDAQRARRDVLRRFANRDSAAARQALEQSPAIRRARRLGAEFQELAVVRATLSERQLYEVMVDFWTNHFNVNLAKGADRFLTPDYIEHTIRPHAMGRFEDLLIATAQSPAMLFYLDNWESVAPSSPPVPLSVPERGHVVRSPSPGGRGGQGVRTGLNENYARELLELHTLGVDGGYTQQDVIAVARILTGWSIDRPRQGGGFVFRDWAHDGGVKDVLGVRFPAGHGRDEGLRLLKLLANHPATLHHVSRELCARFVSDDPPDGCVDDAVAAWRRSHGDIREVLRAIFTSPDFWAPRNVGTEVKTPLEYVVSAARATGADPDSTPGLARVVARLGEPLYLHVAPDGYPDREDAWVTSGALLDRMNAAVALAAGRLPGVTVSLDSVVPPTADADSLIGAVNAGVLGGTMSANTMKVIREQVADVRDPVAARALAVGLAVGGPEFQKQ